MDISSNIQKPEEQADALTKIARLLVEQAEEELSADQTKADEKKN